jgi:membrane-bound lytic murein transglycosylase D
LWQFMMNSIPPTMKVNEMMDERRDFRKATVAALRKLAFDHSVLGNWPLALAAYNAGQNGVRRAMQRVNTDDYWVLCARNELPSETIHYVPKLLAVSYILSKPRQFGVDWWPETLEWTVIKPRRQASLNIIAAETGTDRDVLQRLNSELLHGITPPDQDYELVIPLATAPMIAAILERDDLRLLLYYRYQIKYGDTLSALSRHYGVSVNLIEQHNPGISGRYLRIGETIIIPAIREISPYSGGIAATQGAASQGAGGTHTGTHIFRGTHTVVQGDTLWSLAFRFGVSPQVLAAENGMELNQILSIGRVLRVPIIE